MLSKYRSVLAVAGSARLFASALVGRLPQGMSSLAILLLVRGATRPTRRPGSRSARRARERGLRSAAGPSGRRFGRARVLGPSPASRRACTCCSGRGGGRRRRCGADPLAALAGALLPPIAPVVRALLRDVSRTGRARHRVLARRGAPGDGVDRGPARGGADHRAHLAGRGGGAARRRGHLLFLRSPLVQASRPAHTGLERHSALASAERARARPVALTGRSARRGGAASLALHAGRGQRRVCARGVGIAAWPAASGTARTRGAPRWRPDISGCCSRS